MKHFVLTFFMGLGSTFVCAQQIPNDLKTLINRSFTYFPAFKELDQAVDVENRKVELAKTVGLPIVSAVGSYHYLNPVSELTIPIGDKMTPFNIMPNNNYKTMVNGQYTLWDNGQAKAGIERAKAGLQYAKDNIEANKAQMAFHVSGIYYQIAYLQGAIAIQDSVINFLKLNKQDTENKFKNGDALKYDVLSIQSNIDQENNRKIDLLNNLRKQHNLMVYTTGFQSNKEEIDFNIKVFSENKVATNVLEKARESNTVYLLLKDKIALAESELKMSKIQGKPALVLNTATGFANGYVPNIDKFRYTYQIGATLNIPIYQGGRIKKQIALSQEHLTQTKIEQHSLDNTFQKNIDQALSDITSYKASLLNADDQISETMEAQKLAQSRFRNGTGTNLELINASTNVQRAELNRLQYQYQLCMASLELIRLEGIVYW